MTDQSVESMKHPSRYHYEVKTSKDITEPDLKDFADFVKHEADLFKLSEGTPDWNDKGTVAFVHSLALKTIRNETKNNSDMSIIFSRDNEENIVGYSLVCIPPENKRDGLFETYLGVKTENQHQGIGTELLKRRLNILSGMGINSYKTNARDEVIRLYDKLGIKYTKKPAVRTTDGMEISVSF